MKNAVCLLSGGMDSAVACAVAENEGYRIYALTFDYGQKHAREVAAAIKLARDFGVEEHKTVDLDLGGIFASALTGKGEIPEERTLEDIKEQIEIPRTYVPARNTVFLSLALAYAETRDCEAIYIGAHAVDYSGYPDCRPEYFKRYQEMADLATKKAIEGKRIEIKTPLINDDKAEIVRKGVALGVDFSHTWSCYSGTKKACGKCDACKLRLGGFKEAGYKDPVEYER
ncbi:MAG: 7-cyano-7-deazaguanine synthase QueC [Candidatus Altiarchaeales archaeon ex4484_2]|nr:MAG: 7-cyano-7-deazaguanine synthase QueC [Candidatus Altiarchaeales archaeon ex4484_2]